MRESGSCVTDCDLDLIGRDCDWRRHGCDGSFGWRTYHRASLHGHLALIRCMLTCEPSPVGRSVYLCLRWGWIHCFGFRFPQCPGTTSSFSLPLPSRNRGNNRITHTSQPSPSQLPNVLYLACEPIATVTPCC